MVDKGLESNNCHKNIFLDNKLESTFYPFKAVYENVTANEIQYKNITQISIDDLIFDTLKRDYPKYKDWMIRKSQEGRKAYVCFNNDNSLAAVLILKLENETIDSVPLLTAKNRLKISTLIVSDNGHGIGTRLINKAIEEATKYMVEEIYFTHFTQKDDELVKLFSKYGFKKAAVIKGTDNRAEDIYIKEMCNDESEENSK